MFKVIIDENKTVMQGTTLEILAGLACYVEALKNNNVPNELIRKVVELGLKDEEKNTKENEKIKIDINTILKKIFE